VQPKPNTGSAPASAAAAQPARSFQDIVEDFQKTVDAFHERVVATGGMRDEAKRAQAAPTAIPILKRGIADLNELKASGNPQAVAMAKESCPFSPVSSPSSATKTRWISSIKLPPFRSD